MRVNLQGFQVPQKRFDSKRHANTPYRPLKRQNKASKPFRMEDYT